MTIIIWLLNIIAYIAYIIYMYGRPSDLLLGIGLAALVIGFIGLATDRRPVLLTSFVILAVGIGFSFSYAFRIGLPWIWGLALIITLFFGSLSLRGD